MLGLVTLGVLVFVQGLFPSYSYRSFLFGLHPWSKRHILLKELIEANADKVRPCGLTNAKG